MAYISNCPNVIIFNISIFTTGTENEFHNKNNVNC